MNLGQRIRVVFGSITEQRVDAIVTAANAGLRGGGGVDGAVHAAAGPGLLVECAKVAPCPTGEARITGAGRLPALHVIHAVGPVYRDGASGEEIALRAAYSSSLKLAREADCRSIAFPSISTGVYGYPKREACQVAVRAVVDWLTQETLPECVTFCCFDSVTAMLYEEELRSRGIRHDTVD